ncbi:unnamed protein product, partial [Prorocentrum cordatum]
GTYRASASLCVPLDAVRPARRPPGLRAHSAPARAAGEKDSLWAAVPWRGAGPAGRRRRLCCAGVARSALRASVLAGHRGQAALRHVPLPCAALCTDLRTLPSDLERTFRTASSWKSGPARGRQGLGGCLGLHAIRCCLGCEPFCLIVWLLRPFRRIFSRL